MLLLISILIVIHLVIALQCHVSAQKKGYPRLLFSILGMIPYFNLVVWVYLLFLPNITEYNRVQHSSSH